MAKHIERRLQALERAAPPCKGMVIASESLDEPGAFFDGKGQRYTSEALTALAGQGWQVIMVCYEDQPPARDTVKLMW